MIGLNAPMIVDDALCCTDLGEEGGPMRWTNKSMRMVRLSDRQKENLDRVGCADEVD